MSARLERAVLLIGAATAAAMTVTPLLAVPGPESALVLAAVLSPFVAGGAAGQVAVARARGALRDGWHAVRLALAHAARVLALTLVVFASGALTVRVCAPLDGLAFIILGPVIGLVVAALLGAAAGGLPLSPRVTVAGAVGVVLASYGRTVARVVTTPAISLFDSFAGWFPGTLYDEGITLPAALVTFRAFSVALASGLACLVVAFYEPARRRFTWRSACRRPWPLLGGAACFVAVALGELHAEELGHRTSSERIDTVLGAVHHGRRCIVHAPRELPLELRELMTRDCDVRVEMVERRLGVRHAGPVTAFFFRDAAEKQRLMGASRTYVAKPWRSEVYLQVRPVPHPVLFHEIAHVVAGVVARGPFRVAGPWGGLLPSPGIIEGTAVALAWDGDDVFTAHEWSRALLARGELPPLASLVTLRFLTAPKRHAYTAAGSFMRFVFDRYGAAAVRRIYRVGTVGGEAGSLADLERQWHAFLRSEAPAARAVAMLGERFAPGTVFDTPCPHVRARLGAELGAALAAGADGDVRRVAAALLDLDDHDVGASLALLSSEARHGVLSSARARLAALSSVAPPSITAAGREVFADALYARGDMSSARAMYAALVEEEALDEPRLRGIDVKMAALGGSAEAAALVRDLLLGSPTGSVTPVAAIMALARSLEAAGQGAIGDYLSARQLAGVDRPDLAIPALERALASGLPSVRLEREAVRLWGESLLFTGRYAEARRAAARLHELAVTSSHHVSATDLDERAALQATW